MSNLFSLSYSNKKKRQSVGWKDDSIHHPFVRRGKASFCDEKMKIAGSDRKNLSSEYCRLIVLGARVAQWVRSLDLTTHTSLSPIRRVFAPGFVNYKKGALDSQPQVIKFTSCLHMVGGFLWVLRLPPQLKLAAEIIRCIKNDNDLLNMFSSWIY
jgi:hypothetical protein